MKPLLTLHDPATARRYYAEGLWRDDTLYSLLADHAAARPEAFALRDRARRLTWRELQVWVDAIAHTLDDAGIRKGDRVSMWLSNRAEAVAVLLACSRNGYVCNPSLHRNYTVAEVLELVERIGAAALFAEEGWGIDGNRQDVFGLASRLDSMRKVFRLPNEREAGNDLPSPEITPRHMAGRDVSPDKVFYLAFTSGTTGMPKAVMHSDNTLLANARAMVEDWGHGPETVLLSLSPLSHHIAWVGLAQALAAGGEFAVDDVPPGLSRLDWIVESGATYVMGVPTHAMDILAEQRARGLAQLGRVKLFYMAGAPIPRTTAEAFLAQGVTPQNIYGMTENSSHHYTLPTDDADTIVGTCGRAGRGYEIRIFKRDNPDEEAPPGEAGQIGGRGACLMLGYFDNQEATETSFNRGGWFMSGDLGRLNERGCLEVVGRLKDMIIRGGTNIYPARLEALAVRHPGIERAAAFPVADERLGEKVCLAIIATGAVPDPEDVLAHLSVAGLSIRDMPEYVVALPEFPLTASGKVLKRELVAMTKSGAISPLPVRWVDPEKRTA